MGGFASALRSLVPRPDEVQRQLLKSLKARLRNPGLRMARSEQTTPKDTGELIDSISVVGPRQEPGQVVGGMQATAPHARRTEYEHPTKALHLLRSLLAVSDAVEDDLSSAGIFREGMDR